MPSAGVGKWAIVRGTVGARSRVWDFAIVDGVVGEDCNICSHTFIEKGAVVGDRVTVKCHVSLWKGITLGDDVFVGPGAVFTNDHWPRSRSRCPETPTLVKQGASIGAGAVILPGIVIGEMAMIGAGAVVVGDVPPGTVVIGNPAVARGEVHG